MGKWKLWLRDLILSAVILTVCFFTSVVLETVFHIPEQISAAFAFAVFLISLLTDGYFFGLASALVSVLLVNYAFTFPYFALDFFIPSNFFSAIVMGVIALLTGALTTKVKHQEAMKAESQRERMRANLLRAISHDLRTPLTTIYGSSAALRENGDRLTPEQKDKMLLGIQEDAQWLVRMVENLLSITRIDSGNVRIDLVSTVLEELVDSVIVKFRKRYPNQPVHLELPEELVMIPMDAMLMEQVLMNLLENAVQHAAGMKNLTLRVTAGEGQAVFEIQDDGCGIPEDRLSRIFSGYYDSKDRPEDARRNAGIGLSVCATIVRAHGGTIQAENLPSGGALFRFTLKTEEMTDEQ